MAAKHDLPIEEDKSFSCFVRLSFQNEKANIMRTLFTQLMLEEGFLAGSSFYPTLAHTDELVEKYSIAVDKVFAKLKVMLDNDTLYLPQWNISPLPHLYELKLDKNRSLPEILVPALIM